MTIGKIRREIKKIDALPTLPGVVKKLSAMVESPDISADQIAGIISKDQVLSARLLKLVNSAFYGFSGRISSISHAFVLLGFNVVKGLAISTSVFDMMKENLGDLWRHSLACSTVAGQIAKAVGEQESEEVAVAGLLHDIGKVAVWAKFPDEMSELMARARNEEKSLAELEKELLGMNHAEIAELLSTQWNLPESLVEPITCHHDPELSKKYRKRSCIIHLANAMVRGLGYTFSSDVYVYPVSRCCWETLSLTDELLESIVEKVMEDIDEVDEFTF